jgi:hypothetical protein
MSQNTMSVSELIRLKDGEEAEQTTEATKSREEWKKQKELEEARKVNKLLIEINN